MSQVEWNIGSGSKVVATITPTAAAEPKAKKSKIKVVLLNLKRDEKWDAWDADRKLTVLSKAGLKRANKV